MRKETFRLLRCPKCQKPSLESQKADLQLEFGPLTCGQCQASYPVSEGIADLAALAQRRTTPRWTDAHFIARSFERYVRPGMQLALSNRKLDSDSEFILYRSFLDELQGPLLDVGCGTGLLTRRLARQPQFPLVVGMDSSRAMLEEAVAQSREACVRVDFLRAEAPYLPFADNSLGAVIQSDTLYVMDNLPLLLGEIKRVLMPGGRYVAHTHVVSGWANRFLHAQAGLFPRGEDELRQLLSSLGFIQFERVALAPWLFLRANKPT